MAAIVSKTDGRLYCGATIIDEYYALTAAHCVNTNGRYASDIELLVGEHDYRNRMLFISIFFFSFNWIFRFLSLWNSVRKEIRNSISRSTPELFIWKGYQWYCPCDIAPADFIQCRSWSCLSSIQVIWFYKLFSKNENNSMNLTILKGINRLHLKVVAWKLLVGGRWSTEGQYLRVCKKLDSMWPVRRSVRRPIQVA